MDFFLETLEFFGYFFFDMICKSKINKYCFPKKKASKDIFLKVMQDKKGIYTFVLVFGFTTIIDIGLSLPITVTILSSLIILSLRSPLVNDQAPRTGSLKTSSNNTG